MKVLCGFVLQNRMDVKNQIAERERFLIKVFSDAPDRAFLYGFAVGKQRTFCQQLIDGSDFAVDGAVVDQDIRVDSGGVERFHLNRHRGQRVFLAAFVERNILPARHRDGLCDVVPRFADIDRAGGIDVEKCDGLTACLLIENGRQRGKACTDCP